MFEEWKPGQHGVAIGQTGSGKTWGCKNGVLPAGLEKTHRLFVVDVEQGFDFPEPVFKARSLSTALKWSAGDKPFIARVEFHLVEGDSQTAEEKFDQLAYGLLDGGGHDLFLYIDESTRFSPHGNAFDAYDELIARARKRNISVVSGTQRPQMISKTVYTQSIHRLWWYVDQYDADGWLQRSATPIFERMNEIPWESYRFLYQKPGGSIEKYDPIPEYDWGAWSR